MQIKKILITGVTGYIGAHLAEYLSLKNYQVIGLVQKNSKISSQNKKALSKVYIYDKTFESINQIFRDEKVDLVIHLAAKTTIPCASEKTPLLVEANIQLGVHLLSAMSQYQCKPMINTGTFSQYFDKDLSHPPCSFYDATKAAFQKIIDYFVFDQALSVMTINLFDVYGAYDKRKKIFYYIKQAKERGESLNVTLGEQLLQMIYIEDVVKGYERAVKMIEEMKSQHKKCFIPGDKKTLKEIIEVYLNVTGYNIKVNWGALPYRKNQIMNPIECGEKIEIEQFTSLEQGIKKIYEKENLNYHPCL